MYLKELEKVIASTVTVSRDGPSHGLQPEVFSLFTLYVLTRGAAVWDASTVHGGITCYALELAPKQFFKHFLSS